MRRLLLLLATLVLGAAPALVVASPAHACSCALATPEEYAAQADVVLEGRVVEDDRGRGFLGRPLDERRFTVETLAVVKDPAGDLEPGERVEVRTATDGAACGLELLGIGGTYRIYATDTGEGLSAGLCGGTTELTAPDPGEGRGDGPVAMEPWPSPGLVLGGLGLTIGLAAGGAVWVRRRRRSADPATGQR